MPTFRGFDTAAALKCPLQVNTRAVRIRAAWLQEFFPAETPPAERVFIVKNPGGDGLARANEAQQNAVNRDQLIEALVDAAVVDKASVLRQSLALTKTGETPSEIARGVELFMQGLAEPAPSIELAVKMKDAAPVDFYAIWRTALELAGEGDQKKTRSDSTRKATSDSP